MDNYNKLFMIIRKTDLLNYDEKNELQLYLMNLKEQVKNQKEVIDRILNETKETRNIINNNRGDNILTKGCLIHYLGIVDDLLEEIKPILDKEVK